VVCKEKGERKKQRFEGEKKSIKFNDTGTYKSNSSRNSM
jgi:hypothetical protein